VKSFQERLTRSTLTTQVKRKKSALLTNDPPIIPETRTAFSNRILFLYLFLLLLLLLLFFIFPLIFLLVLLLVHLLTLVLFLCLIIFHLSSIPHPRAFPSSAFHPFTPFLLFISFIHVPILIIFQSGSESVTIPSSETCLDLFLLHTECEVNKFRCVSASLPLMIKKRNFVTYNLFFICHHNLWVQLTILQHVSAFPAISR
jgi:hypothetical protein